MDTQVNELKLIMIMIIKFTYLFYKYTDDRLNSPRHSTCTLALLLECARSAQPRSCSVGLEPSSEI